MAAGPMSQLELQLVLIVLVAVANAEDRAWHKFDEVRRTPSLADPRAGLHANNPRPGRMPPTGPDNARASAQDVCQPGTQAAVEQAELV